MTFLSERLSKVDKAFMELRRPARSKEKPSRGHFRKLFISFHVCPSDCMGCSVLSRTLLLLSESCKLSEGKMSFLGHELRFWGLFDLLLLIFGDERNMGMCLPANRQNVSAPAIDLRWSSLFIRFHEATSQTMSKGFSPVWLFFL